MASLLQVLLVAGREYHLLNALCLTALIMLCWNPLQLMNVGFQLSFASMLGIALIIPILMEFDEVKEMYKISFLNTGNLILRFLLRALEKRRCVIRRAQSGAIQPGERIRVTERSDHCGGCQHNCLLKNPGCGVGKDKAARGY